MEDHHVDRPGVEARQRVKLTGTNSSFDLITLILRARAAAEIKTNSAFGLKPPRGCAVSFRADVCAGSALRWSGGNCEGISTRSHSELGR